MAKGFSNQTHDPRIQETRWTPGKPCFQAMLVCFFFFYKSTNKNLTLLRMDSRYQLMFSEAQSTAWPWRDWFSLEALGPESWPGGPARRIGAVGPCSRLPVS